MKSNTANAKKNTIRVKRKKSKKTEFSKILLIQESILVWITTIAFIILAFYSIQYDFIGELGWLTALCTALWAAYGISQACYYKKAQAENTLGGVKYQILTRDKDYMGSDDEPLG